MPRPAVTMSLVAKPWWTRFTKALELALFGSVLFEGMIANPKEDGEPLTDQDDRAA